tara:strand:- start:335370 stop:335993 length:624 start_codon:yes stop_codon:yes gene_type:complete
MKNIYCCIAIVIVGSLLSGCAYTSAEMVKAKIAQPAPQRTAFSHCSSYGCTKVQQVAFSDDEWQSITAIFNDLPATASVERHILPQAIAMMERIIGPKTGTSGDIARSWTLTFANKGQLDCIDESINTTTYLQLLQKEGYVRFHDIGKIALRGQGMDIKLLHNTATLIEKNTGAEFAIDSWFRANGIKADVVPLSDWIDGWKPKTSS